jgi:pyruvate dehydrogenase E2 component (dihydrolipoamide acetyltransferase)
MEASMPDQIQVFALPDVGEGLTEGEILVWHVKVGDVVTVNQPLVEIETAKASVELPCPFAGIVTELHAQPGEVVPVGSPIVSITGAAALHQRESVLVGYGVKHGGEPRRRARRATAAPAPVTLRPRVVPLPDREPAPRAKPIVRKLAKDLGVDLAELTGTGDHGVVTREDVLGAVHGVSPAAEAFDVIATGEPVAVRGVQRAMAEAMVLSAFSAPHVTVWVDVDMTRTDGLVRRMRAHPAFADLRPTALTIVSAALVRVAREHPRINATWVDGPEGPVITEHADVNLGLAADTPRGLLVPVVRDAGRLSLVELTRAQKAVIDTARAGRSTPADLTGSTVTLTNIGVFGVDGGTPIINPGESAILAMGRIIDKPWVVDGEVRVRPVMQLSLSFDHRVCDGAQGSRALASVAVFLADPAAELLLG